MYHSSFIHSSVDGCQGDFQSLTIVNNTAMNTGLHIFFQISVLGLFGYTSFLWSFGIAVILLLIFWGISILFSYLCRGTSLHSHQQCTDVLFSSYPHQYLSFVGLMIVAILTGVRSKFLTTIFRSFLFFLFFCLHYQ